MKLTRREKPKAVEELTNMLKGYRCIGIFSLHALPASQLQEIRKKLQGKALIKVAKKTIVKRALEKLGLDALVSRLEGAVGIIASNLSPFELYKEIKSAKGYRAPKPGEVATNNIVVEAGPTDLPPGPAISTLQQAGLKAKVEGGKITILQPATICKKGEEVSEVVASVCNLLGLTPIEVKLNLLAVWEDGIVYESDLLDINEEEYESRLEEAVKKAFILAIELNFVTPETVEFFIIKAYREMRTLAKELQLPIPEVIEDLIVDASLKAKALEAVLQQA